MRTLITGILMFGLIFGTAAFTRAADFDIHLGKGRVYSNYDRFCSWDARERDRIGDAYRDRVINQGEYDRLNAELGNVEAYHDQAFAKGWMSGQERERLGRMEARLDTNVDREINEHTY